MTKEEMLIDCKELEHNPNCADIKIWSKLTFESLNCLVLLPIKTSQMLIRQLANLGIAFDQSHVQHVKIAIMNQNYAFYFYSLLLRLEWNRYDIKDAMYTLIESECE